MVESKKDKFARLLAPFLYLGLGFVVILLNALILMLIWNAVLVPGNSTFGPIDLVQSALAYSGTRLLLERNPMTVPIAILVTVIKVLRTPNAFADPQPLSPPPVPPNAPNSDAPKKEIQGAGPTLEARMERLRQVNQKIEAARGNKPWPPKFDRKG